MVLRVLSGAEAGKTHPLKQGTYMVGKNPTCDIVLTDKAVSRQHLKLEVHDEHVVATDLGSHNGSFVEGLRFTAMELRPGAVLTLGTTELKLVPEDTRERSLPLSSRDRFGALVGGSRKMREAFTVLERLAPGGADVLIHGETGTGKDLCAEAIHQQSPRAKGPFVIVDLAGVPSTLIESELFGHVKGSFTGAQGDRAGAFERAQNGTVFLDEIGELPLDLQPRLLRVLERRQVKRVGGNDYFTVNVRVVAASHVNLEQAVQQGKFRRDLFHRLAVLRVTLPALRERPEDIPLLIDHMLKLMGRQPGALSDQTRALLMQYPWPGNVRELRNVVEQVVNLGEEALPDLEAPPGTDGRKGPDLDLPFKEAKEHLIEVFERDYLKNLIERCEGNISRASREADIDRVYLRKLLRKHGLDPSGEP
ncbi:MULTISPECIES: sigma 54-interacting transcriptional regulator [unclassified Corallococcus]|uniref:sigma 54-interacting transcriptional regulator n=1 Tax=unclassified Corallococcus TaxID=2685029 RepID=UPI001F5DA936|nr:MULTISPECIES: sigma 54-interacting transcriptional regulator [unclassified Corallococcus]WAS89379.1 sigma 54-interacting transcriptional regulator [Corallococcus sp. NCRR]